MGKESDPQRSQRSWEPVPSAGCTERQERLCSRGTRVPIGGICVIPSCLIRSVPSLVLPSLILLLGRQGKHFRARGRAEPGRAERPPCGAAPDFPHRLGSPACLPPSPPLRGAERATGALTAATALAGGAWHGWRRAPSEQLCEAIPVRDGWNLRCFPADLSPECGGWTQWLLRSRLCLLSQQYGQGLAGRRVAWLLQSSPW